VLGCRAAQWDDLGAQQAKTAKPRDNATAELGKIVIIGGGAAGFAAAEMLRRQGYQNSITMLSSDEALPYDRPNLSKDYLAGTIPFDYVPLRDERFYAQQHRYAHGAAGCTGRYSCSRSHRRRRR
jgi:cation diffusion facilitator CzcD-associated flavoprotein CzcO